MAPAFEPVSYADGDPGLGRDVDGREWTPVWRHACAFGPDIFLSVMLNLIKNPNINSSWLFRADILYDQDSQYEEPPDTADAVLGARSMRFPEFAVTRTIVRRLVPRNTQRDRPLDQTCIMQAKHAIREGDSSDLVEQEHLVVYLPHVDDPSAIPFYHPAVRGIAFQHRWRPSASEEKRGEIAIHYLLFDPTVHPDDTHEVLAPTPLSPDSKLSRTALQLLGVLHKHGAGRLAGYSKRVRHDELVPQAQVQNTYARLKARYARGLVASWAETTDPAKHVFEDLGIAAFLIELWRGMYALPVAALVREAEETEGVASDPDQQDAVESDLPEFPGFVDIGCGNGLLVHLLVSEGYPGWGFDARARKSWAQYNSKVRVPGTSSGLNEGPSEDMMNSLQELVLLPEVCRIADQPDIASKGSGAGFTEEPRLVQGTQNGVFPAGTFIISNHADELTPWTPVLAAQSRCPFIAIPCCSHALDGSRFRAPPPSATKRDANGKTRSASTYSSMVEWVAGLAEACGWVVEREMLRIPSTRNTALVGRKRRAAAYEGGPGGEVDAEVDIERVVQAHGGAKGFGANVARLLKGGGCGH